jgi:peroxiredoxin
MTTTVSENILKKMVTNKGNDILKLSEQTPVQLIFLRHFGCTFCIKALKDIQENKLEVEGIGTKIVIVHMVEPSLGQEYLDKYKIGDIEHISDKDVKFYVGFGLMKGNFKQVFGLANMIRGFQNNYFEGAAPMTPYLGDMFQMPGVFLLHQGEIVKSFIHKLISDQPDYIQLSRI